MANTTRLFIGTFLPAEEQAKVEQWQAQNNNLSTLWHRHIKWVKTPKLHLTWLFLGQVEKENIPLLQNHLGTVSKLQHTLEFSYEQVKIWPDQRQARQVVLIPDKVPEEATKIVTSICTAIGSFTDLAIKKPWKPHITLLRLKDASEKQSQNHDTSPTKKYISPAEIKGLERLLPIVQHVDDICLIRSHLGNTFDEYKVIEQFPLQYHMKQ